MKLLFKLAFQKRSNYLLIIFTIVSMCLFTIGTQLEIITIGILTNKEQGFFELFGPVKNSQSVATDKITRKQLEERFDEIGGKNKGYIDRQDIARFSSQVKPKGLVGRAIFYLNQIIPLSGHPKNLAIVFVVIAIFNAASMFCHRFSTKLIAIHVSRDLRQNYFEHIQKLPMSFYQKHNIGSLSSRVATDAFAIADGINASLINYLQTPFAIISTLFLCFASSWKLSLIIFLGLPIIVYPIVYIARHVKRISKQLQKNQENFSSVLVDYLGGIQTIKMFAMEGFSLGKYRIQNEQMARLEKKSAKYDVSSRPIVHTLGMFFLAIALITGLYILNLSVPEVIVYCGLLYIFYEPVKKFAETNAQIQRGAAAAERMYEVMQITPEINDAPDAVDLEEFNGSIEFRNVSFRYSDDWVLKDLSFTIKKGQTVALVGPTGAGKSTIVQLICRLYDVQKGEILIDGKPLQTYTQKSLRRLMAFVPQKPFLFLDTIAENIAFGSPYTQSEIVETAQKAHAHEFIQDLPKAYNTELSEMGKNLSGGQQQRLAIARALFKNAPILVMDEATSSLDALSENHIKTAIKDLKGDMTQVIIAHRLSTVEDADKIIYLEKGQKVAEGALDELIQNCPPFKLMWNMFHKQKTHV